MYTNTSAAFDAAIKSDSQIVCSKITLTLKDGTIHNLTDGDFIGKSLEINKSAFANDSFSLGGTVSKEIRFSLNNQDKRWDNVNFKGAKVKAYSGIYIDGAPEYVPMGTFWLDSAGKPLDTIDITGVDSILKLEKSYSGSALPYPATVKQILQEIASKCEIPLSSAEIYNGNFVVNKAPDKSKYTYRDILSFVSVIAGGFASINRNDELSVIRINKSGSPVCTIGPSMRSSSRTDYQISISGMAYYGGEGINRLYGTDEYPLIIENNPLIDNMSITDRDTVLDNLYKLYEGFTYTPFECDFIGDPRLDEGDMVDLTGTRDGDVRTYIFKYTFTNGSTQILEAPACDELDKNFLAANSQKEADKNHKIETSYENQGGGSSGPSSEFNVIRNHIPIANHTPVSCNSADNPGTTKDHYYIKLINENGSPFYSPEWNKKFILCMFRASDYKDGPHKLDGIWNWWEKEELVNTDYLDFSAITMVSDEVYDLRLYTEDEFNMLQKSFKNNFNLYPIYREITPDRFIFNSANKNLKLDVIVKNHSVKTSNPAQYVTETQLAKVLHYIWGTVISDAYYSQAFGGFPRDSSRVLDLISTLRMFKDDEAYTVEPEKVFMDPVNVKRAHSTYNNAVEITYVFIDQKQIELEVYISNEGQKYIIPLTELKRISEGAITIVSWDVKQNNMGKSPITEIIFRYDTVNKEIYVTLNGESEKPEISKYLNKEYRIY